MCWMLLMRTRKRLCSWKCGRSRCGAGRSGRRNWREKGGTLSASEQSQKKVTTPTHHHHHLTFVNFASSCLCSATGCSFKFFKHTDHRTFKQSFWQKTICSPCKDCNLNPFCQDVCIVCCEFPDRELQSLWSALQKHVHAGCDKHPVLLQLMFPVISTAVCQDRHSVYLKSIWQV